MTKLPMRHLPALLGAFIGSMSGPIISRALGQTVSPVQHAAEIMKAFPCAEGVPYRVEVIGPDSVRARLAPLACPLVRQALKMVAAGRARHLGVNPGDVARLRFAEISELRFEGFDTSGKRVPEDDEAYWAVALLFGDPARTIEHDVYIGTRKTLLRKTEPMDTTMRRRPPG